MFTQVKLGHCIKQILTRRKWKLCLPVGCLSGPCLKMEGCRTAEVKECVVVTVKPNCHLESNSSGAFENLGQLVRHCVFHGCPDRSGSGLLNDVHLVTCHDKLILSCICD